MPHPADRLPSRGGSTARRLLLAAVAVLTGVGSLTLAAPAQAGGGDGPVPPEYVVAEVLPPIKCARAARNAGWQDENLVIATAVALAESGCDPKAVGQNGPTEGCPSGSRDRGAWQINDCYHSEVSDACAFKLRCNARAAYQIFEDAGNAFQPWTSYNSRAFRYYLTEARKAVKRLTGEKIVVGVVWTEGGSLTIRKRPTTKSEAVGSLPDRAVIVITCQTRGEKVYSPVFDYETRLWDSLGPEQYVSDGFVYTDSTKRIAPRC